MDEGRAVSLLSLAEESAAELKGLDAKAWIARLNSEYGSWSWRWLGSSSASAVPRRTW